MMWYAYKLWKNFFHLVICHCVCVCVCVCVFLFFIFMHLFLNVYFERESVCTHKWGRGRDRGRERMNPKQTLYYYHIASSMRGLISQIMRSWPEPKSRVGSLTDWATLGSLHVFFFRLTQQKFIFGLCCMFSAA